MSIMTVPGFDVMSRLHIGDQLREVTGKTQ
jgi:hypothetical protein